MSAAGARPRPRVVVVGDTFVDIVAGSMPRLPTWGTDVLAPIEAHPGGSAQNTAANLARLGVDTTLFSAVGADVFGDIILQHCRDMGVHWVCARHLPPKTPTGVCIVLSGAHDRCFVTHAGASGVFSVEEAMEAEFTLQATHVHIGGFFSCTTMRKHLAPFLASLRSRGCTVSLDTNYDASGRWGEVDGLLNDILPLVDVFLPNETEAKAIAGTGTITEALDKLAALVQDCVVVTVGEHGAIARRKNERVSVEAPAIAPVDPVGAGDAFNAGFLACYVDNPLDLRAAMRTGCVAGAVCIGQRGACKNPPTREELHQFARVNDYALE